MSYQSITSAGDSKSAEKLVALNLPPLQDKSFLDIGCNEGFFCGAALASGAARVVGVDAQQGCIDSARNHFINAVFHCEDWNDFLARENEKFDVILCASALHYAQDQEGFLRQLLSKLKRNGCLILECGIGEGNEKFVAQERWDGRKYYFTKSSIDSFFNSERSQIFKYHRSVDQAGDSFGRYVIHVRNLSPTVIVNFDPPGSGKSTLGDRLGAAANIIHIDDVAVEFARRSTSAVMRALEHNVYKLWDVIQGMRYSGNVIEEIVGLAKPSDVQYIEGYVPANLQGVVIDELNVQGYIVHQVTCRSQMPTKQVAETRALKAAGGTYFIGPQINSWIDNADFLAADNHRALYVDGWCQSTNGVKSLRVLLDDGSYAEVSHLNTYERNELQPGAVGFGGSFDLSPRQAKSLQSYIARTGKLEILVARQDRILSPMNVRKELVQALQATKLD